MKTEKDVNQVLATEYSQPKTIPVVKRLFNTLQRIKCYTYSTIKAENEALQYEIRQMKQEWDEFVKEIHLKETLLNT